jgi:polyisoprenoid-binding protein YceI
MTTHTAAQASTLHIESTRWRIDPAESRIEFRTTMLWGLSTVAGRFSRYAGTLDLSRRPAIELTIETESIDTSNKKRDAHLCSPAFFDTQNHPTARFVSQSATLNGDRLTVRGRLHARGSSTPLELDATVSNVDDELEIKAATDADHRQLGITYGKLLVQTPTQLIINARLVRDDA